jgi:2-phosphoglycerate kinase
VERRPVKREAKKELGAMKQALPGSEKLLEQVLEHLGPKRAPLLIAIDGADGVGKSSLASWLAWQIGAPAIHLDL